jgi:uncharacterized protein (TIGR03000 family)
MPRYLPLAFIVAALCLVPVRAAEPTPAIIEIVLPPNAKLYVSDDLIRSKPGPHRLETPPLEMGKGYTYEFHIEIEHDGKTETFTRKVPVRAGETSKADFTELLKAPPKEQPKPDEPKPDEPKPDKPKPEKSTEGEFKMSDIEREIVERTNAERKKKDLPELKPNPKLFLAARKHTENMVRLDKMAHELEGKKPSDRVKETGYPGTYVGENVAYGLRNAEDVMKGWMGSEGHRKNILEANYTEIGVGVVKGQNGALYFTQVFAKPSR